MTAPTAGTTPRPWTPATVNDLPHGEPDIQFAVYAVNHIEAAEAALTEALAREPLYEAKVRQYAVALAIATRGNLTEALAEADAFLAAHAAPEEKPDERFNEFSKEAQAEAEAEDATWD